MFLDVSMTVLWGVYPCWGVGFMFIFGYSGCPSHERSVAANARRKARRKRGTIFSRGRGREGWVRLQQHPSK